MDDERRTVLPKVHKYKAQVSNRNKQYYPRLNTIYFCHFTF